MSSRRLPRRFDNLVDIRRDSNMISPTLDRILDATIRVGADFRIDFVSEQGLVWLGEASARDLPTRFLDLVHPDDRSGCVEASAGDPEYFTCDARIAKREGSAWTHIRGYKLPGPHQYVLCLIDISAWKSDAAIYRHAAEHDDLTGLANRALLKRTIESRIRAGSAPFSIALLDLDGFKKVNDTFGHAIGDAVLIETAQRLGKFVGPNDLLARLGGDEFVLLFAGKDASATGNALANVLLAMARPFDTGPHNAYLGVSAGIAEFPGHGEDYSKMLKNADTAMYQSKKSGKNRVSIFREPNEGMDLAMNAAIHKGIEEGEFFIEYQPQFDMSRRLVGAEALMRWNSRTLGRVAPDTFIPVIEDSSLMPFMGKWALRFSCHQLKHFQTLLPDFVMSVNVSPIQFGSDDFAAEVLDCVAEAGIDPARLVLEITESTLMHSHIKTERDLAALRDAGVRIAIDDFGTGFSSLAYLTRFPVSSIKIDRAFVTAIGAPHADPVADKRLVTAMINLAHSIDLKVVAEGVETEAQLAFLEESGCNLVQGYLLGKPMSATAILELLARAAEGAPPP